MNEPTTTSDLAVAVTTMNNMRTIERAVRSVQPIAARIVAVDSGSTDGTIERCRSMGVEVTHRDWDGPTNQKQYAIDRCGQHRWVLLLDADESLEPPLQSSIAETLRADEPKYQGWSFNRKVWFQGDWLNHAFQPEWRLRLFRGGAGRVVGIGPQGRGGHDRIVVDGRCGRLRGVCRHDSWRDLQEMCQRSLGLAQRAAAYYPSGGSLFNILASPPAAFLKQVVLKRAFLDGRRGVIAAGAMALHALLKHLFIAERRAGLDRRCP
ncbi:MAG: glycosyltransferase family 2 protein [Planctomycetota bacterium]